MSAEARRLEIIDAAARAIVTHGVAGFRVRDVADEAGVSQPLVSTHFRSRDELVLAAFTRSDERAMAALEQRSEAAANAREALRMELLACLDDAGDPVVAQSFRLWQELWTHGFGVPELREAVQDRQRAWVSRIGELVRAATADGSASSGVDVDATAVMLNALIDGLAPALRWGYVDLETARSVLDEALRDRLDN
jgi:AcrR family transcriptional regulator